MKIKKIILGCCGLILLCILIHAASPGVVKTVSSSSVPEQLTTNSVRFRTVVFLGYKAVRTPNVGTVWIQTVSTNDSAGIPIASGQAVSLTLGTEFSFANANEFWVDVENNGDGVVYFLMQ